MSQASKLVALTGATGFIGRRLVPALQGAGYRVRALVRREDPRLMGRDIEQVQGALEDPAALAAFTAGASAVVHAAGLVLAPHASAFHEVNVAGTRRLAQAAMAAGTPRFVMISSLSAREPGLSPYAASKHEAERALRELGPGLDLAILRPPAVYGPGDRATLPLFRQLARGFLLAPAAEARFSLIYVDDLAFLVCGILRAEALPQGPIEPDDGQPGGYGWEDVARIAEESLERRVRLWHISRRLIQPVAGVVEASGRLMGRATFLSRGKLAELFHPDWLAHGAQLADWRPWTLFADGFPATLAWYRAQGWIRH
jgi:nucleoside-diphosphate-sugar epimerase